MSVTPSLPRRWCRSALLVVGATVLATGCGRVTRPDVVVVSPQDTLPGESGQLVFLEWPQTIGLLCNHVDDLRAVPDCNVVSGPVIEESLRGVVATTVAVDGTVASLCAAGPAVLRAGFDLMLVNAEETLARELPDAQPADLRMAQAFNVGALLVILETECPERFDAAGVVAREVIVDYNL